MNKFIMGMIVATAIILLYIYRKKIFVAAQDGNTSGNGNQLITVPTSSATSKAMPGTDGAMLGKMIADMMALKAKEEQPGTSKDIDYRPSRPSWRNAPAFDIGKMTINRAIEYPKASFCNCGNPIDNDCGCSQNWDYQ